MNRLNIVEVLNQLNSSKIKERNHALDELTTILKQEPDAIPTKALAVTAEHLIEALDLEERRYSEIRDIPSDTNRGKLSLIENRVSTTGYVIRLFIEKTSSRFKTRTLELLLVAIPELIIKDGHDNLLASVSSQLSYGMLLLVESELFKSKFQCHKWISIADKICEFLDKQVKTSINDRSCINFLSIISALLSLDSIALYECSVNIIETIISFLRKSKKESGTTRLILEIINKLVVKTHCLNVKEVLVLINEAMTYGLAIDESSNELIQLEFALFDYFSSGLLRNNMPCGVGVEIEDPENAKELFLSQLREYLVLRLLSYKSTALQLDELEFEDHFSQRKSTPFEFDNFQLKKSSSALPWLKLLSLYELLVTYFVNSTESEGVIPLFKKRKSQAGYASMISASSNIQSFISKCLADDSVIPLRLLGLQLLMIDCSLTIYSQDELKGFKELTLKQLDAPSLLVWSLACLSILLSEQELNLSNYEVIKLFKVCLPLVNSQENCKISCVLIARMIKYSKVTVEDNQLTTQIFDIYELSAFYGPAIVSNESFQFWYYLHYYGEAFKSRDGSFAEHKILQWLQKRITQLELLDISQCFFNRFIAWLCQKNINNNNDDRIYHADMQRDTGQSIDLYLAWINNEVFRDFLLQSKVSNKIRKIKKDRKPIPKTVHRCQAQNIILQILDLIDQKKTSGMQSGLSCLFEILRAVNSLVGDYSYTEFLVSIKTSASLVFSTLNFQEKDDFANFFKELAKSDLPIHILSDILDLRTIFLKYKQFLMKAGFSEDWNSQEHNNYSQSALVETKVFGRKKNDLTIISELHVSIIALCRLYRHSNVQECLSIFGEFVTGLSSQLFFEAFSTLLLSFEEIGGFEEELHCSNLEHLTELIGTHFLSVKYNTANYSIYHLSKFLDLTRAYWVNQHDSSLHEDCCDILNWIIMRFEDGSFSGVGAICSVSKLLLHLLMYHNLTQAKIKGKKQRIFATFISCLTRLDRATIATQIDEIVSYMNTVSYKNQYIIFSELKSLFKSPCESLEAASTYAYVMSKVTIVSYPFMVYSITELLTYNSEKVSLFYAKASLREILFVNRLRDEKQLFDVIKFDILSHWIIETKPSRTDTTSIWQVEFFGFTDLTELFSRYSVEIGALYLAYGSENTTIMEYFRQLGKSDLSEILKDTFFLTIPLSYVQFGIQGKIHDVGAQLLGKNMVRYNKKFRISLFKWLLCFIDLGSLGDLKAHLQKEGHKSILLDQIPQLLSSTLKYKFPLNITLHKALELLDNFSLDKLPLVEARLISLWILADLRKSKFPVEKARCLRQLSFILVLFPPLFLDPLLMSVALRSLSKILCDPFVHDETANIISVILTRCFSENIDIANNLSEVYLQVFHCMKREDFRCSDALKNTLSEIRNFETLSHFRIWKYCGDVIKGEPLTTKVLDFDEFVNATECAVENLSLMSVLFSYIKWPKLHEPAISPSSIGIQNLISLDVPSFYISDNFRLWTAYYVSEYQLELDMNANGPNTHQFNRIEFSTLKTDVGSLNSLHNIFLDFIQEATILQNARVVFLCDIILSNIIHLYSQEQVGIIREKYLDYRTCSNTLEKESLDSMIGPILLEDNAIFLSKHYLENKILYEDWLLSFISGLLKSLAISFPYTEIFYILCQESISFSESILPTLLALVLYYDPKDSMSHYEEMLAKTSHLLKVSDSDKKIRIIVQLVTVIRSGSRKGDRVCQNLYSKLDLEALCKLMSEARYLKFSYMLFEETSMSRDLPLNIQLLLEIYEKLDDIDLLSGLPSAHSLQDAFSSIRKSDPDSWKGFLFSSAKFDCAYNGNLQIDEKYLVHSLESNGLYALTSIFSRATQGRVTNESYEWSLQLNNWDLPLPEKIDSKESALYYSLKRNMNEPNSFSDNLKQSLIQIIDSKPYFEDVKEWLSSVREVSMMRELVSSYGSPDRIASMFQKYDFLDQQELSRLNFSEYKNDIQWRYSFSNAAMLNNKIIKKPDSVELQLISLFQLASCIKCAVFSAAPQDALRNSFMMETLLELNRKSMSMDENIMKVYERQHLFLSTKSLWESGEFKAPINILKDLLSESLDFYSSFNSRYRSLSPFFLVSQDEVRAYLVKWTSDSRLESATNIYDKYISEREITIDDHELRADVLYIYGEFLGKQIRKLQENGSITETESRCDASLTDLKKLRVIYTDKSLPETERKEAKRHYNKVHLQYNADKEILNSLFKQREKFAWNALHFYLKVLVFTNKYDSDGIDKFCGLWFEYDTNLEINKLLYKEIGTVPSWKFLPWVNQIASKLSSETSEFQKPLQLTMKRLLYKLPYDSLYSIMSIRLYRMHIASDETMVQRVEAAERILKELQSYEKGAFYKDYVLPVQEFCEKSVDLANIQASRSASVFSLDKLSDGRYWTDRLYGHKLPLPTSYTHILSSADGKKERPYIISVNKEVAVTSTGISLPKIVTFTISDGSVQRVLMKGSNDDLRQDAIMEQVFQQVNNILRRSKDLKKLHLGIRTYKVIPLGPKAGIIEFVANSIALHEILSKLHKNDNVKFEQARKLMRSVQMKGNSERLDMYTTITREIRPQLRNFFFDSFTDPDEWFVAKKNYVKGIAATSIVGHMLGLGDRHLNNILLDSSTGEPIHIDLGVAFDQGKLLPIPELVPFRLTRDIIDGFGVTGTDGLFTKSCEQVYSVLRKEYEKVMCVLNVLKWDPLYSWVMSPMKKHKHLLEDDDEIYGELSSSKPSSSGKDHNNESYRALKSVEDKLIGNGLSVEATIQDLIQEATNPENLAVIYMGWSPFY
ncbi:hypothetical protein KAFR_0L01900 [Kazachstania africana CBS 2517]|uniref:Serine/threonine-protein kinase Tel1 n=1 Tax=Kazachstania africana (strain ATCC 22294 / BCRC 22015 / CBS 2517 / CECT 1963 / NBRC 1671 / NRRL Y-8276) TaxID=1071382 RepID=H2B2F0_KAZAF|nr:hypothetical protein KAFR_0L01900 [Kazachstania africana CBS 2517]CCF60800.1 hypothetical protein KAFR_0L01900 [Kazachstania africana CBS 2517]